MLFKFINNTFESSGGWCFIHRLSIALQLRSRNGGLEQFHKIYNCVLMRSNFLGRYRAIFLRQLVRELLHEQLSHRLCQQHRELPIHTGASKQLPVPTATIIGMVQLLFCQDTDLLILFNGRLAVLCHELDQNEP